MFFRTLVCRGPRARAPWWQSRTHLAGVGCSPLANADVTDTSVARAPRLYGRRRVRPIAKNQFIQTFARQAWDAADSADREKRIHSNIRAAGVGRSRFPPSRNMRSFKHSRGRRGMQQISRSRKMPSFKYSRGVRGT